VGRTADLERIYTNVRRLKTETKVVLHLDLVAGLPGEDYAGFLNSLQIVAGLKPDMLQIEPLKLLKGAPMRAIADLEGYAWSETPPYTILRNRWLSFDQICRIETIGRLLDLFGKHGGFKSAFQVLQRHKPFADILDQMAERAGNENLSSFSCRRVFELFARLAEPLPDLIAREELYDSLFFDYCRVEMPMADKLPSFVATKQGECSWLRQKDLPDGLKGLEDLDIPPGSRVKTFRYTFMVDYRSIQWHPVPTRLTFVYISTAGRSLKIVTV
jgi:anaerobic magnesium-protoporphyrin IX monomethyl ester cyclase